MLRNIEIDIHGIENLLAVDSEHPIFHYKAISDQNENAIVSYQFSLFTEQGKKYGIPAAVQPVNSPMSPMTGHR
ncbi:MAG: hypothetical protein LUH07_03165 [Lachnospiraceae bacterium]|nr:hypothetical protein [Lachnospiraceae bacterium]